MVLIGGTREYTEGQKEYTGWWITQTETQEGQIDTAR
jgi:hypothetical protein